MNHSKNIIKQQSHSSYKQTAIMQSGLADHLNQESNTKLEYTTLKATLTPPSSSASSTTSSSSSSSIDLIKKLNSSHVNSKRKLGIEQKVSPDNFNNSQKPVYSEYFNSKSLLHIYYKGDMLSVIDDHFKKSFNSSRLFHTSNTKPRVGKVKANSNKSNPNESYLWPGKTTPEVNTWTNPDHKEQSQTHDYGHFNAQIQATAVPGYENSWCRPYNHYDYTNINNSLSKIYHTVTPQQQPYGELTSSDTFGTSKKVDQVKEESE